MNTTFPDGAVIRRSPTVMNAAAWARLRGTIRLLASYDSTKAAGLITAGYPGSHKWNWLHPHEVRRRPPGAHLHLLHLGAPVLPRATEAQLPPRRLAGSSPSTAIDLTSGSQACPARPPPAPGPPPYASVAVLPQPGDTRHLHTLPPMPLRLFHRGGAACHMAGMTSEKMCGLVINHAGPTRDDAQKTCRHS